MNKITAIIVDDEQESRNTLNSFLLKYCPDVSVVAEASSIATAVKEIAAHKPQLVFLDINMPGGPGFELFDVFPEPAFRTIFITAYDEYALKAIKYHAFDYLLKPIDIDELIATIGRVKKLINSDNKNNDQLRELIMSLHKPVLSERLALPVLNGFVYVDIRDIVRCEAEGSYTYVHFTNRSKMLISRPLGSYEAILSEHGFVRIHHHHLINLRHVEKYQRGRGGCVIMSDKKEIDVSQRRRDEFLKRLEDISLQ